MKENILAKLFEHNNWANLKVVHTCCALTDGQLDSKPQSGTDWSIRRTLGAVDTPYQVLQDPFGPLNRRFAVDVPLLGPKRAWQMMPRQCTAYHLEEHPSEDQRQCLDRNEVVWSSGQPFSMLIGSSCGNQQMGARRIRQRGRPTLQHG